MSLKPSVATQRTTCEKTLEQEGMIVISTQVNTCQLQDLFYKIHYTLHDTLDYKGINIKMVLAKDRRVCVEDVMMQHGVQSMKMGTAN